MKMKKSKVTISTESMVTIGLKREEWNKEVIYKEGFQTIVCKLYFSEAIF